MILSIFQINKLCLDFLSLLFSCSILATSVLGRQVRDSPFLLYIQNTEIKFFFFGRRNEVMEATGFLSHDVKSRKNLTASPLNFKTNAIWFQQLDQPGLYMLTSKTTAHIGFIRWGPIDPYQTLHGLTNDNSLSTDCRACCYIIFVKKKDVYGCNEEKVNYLLGP